MSTTPQVLVTPISITAQALINKRPVEVVIFTPVNVTDPSIVKVTAPVLVKTLEPVKITVATSPVAVPVVVFNKFVAKVTEASPVRDSSPINTLAWLPVTSNEDPASAVIVPTAEFIESPTTISDVLPFAVIDIGPIVVFNKFNVVKLIATSAEVLSLPKLICNKFVDNVKLESAVIETTLTVELQQQLNLYLL